ncbi:hypothetical protein R6U77_14375 [Lysinibacillus louembei]|uniref:Uncharacterized protein n=1 Tax=Lysinibacillus louembei TaxID=1470088 RepID=A0ABZ0RV38_9BACI|nr:hypothetical protein [Lysinibacillus louembei]WPK11066.1 hypothetical protein R6U77_14375 [Lysinibacillus louembei]
MDYLFISNIYDQNGNPLTQIISSVPSITIAVIASSSVLDKHNTTHGTYVIDSILNQSTVENEIDSYLLSNAGTNHFQKDICSNGTIMYKW